MDQQKSLSGKKHFKAVSKAAQATIRLDSKRRYSLPTITSPLTQLLNNEKNNFNVTRRSDVLPKMSHSMRTVMQLLGDIKPFDDKVIDENDERLEDIERSCFDDEEENSSEIYDLKEFGYKKTTSKDTGSCIFPSPNNDETKNNNRPMYAIEKFRQNFHHADSTQQRQIHSSMSAITKLHNYDDHDNDQEIHWLQKWEKRPRTVSATSSANNSARSSISEAEDEALKRRYSQLPSNRNNDSIYDDDDDTVSSFNQKFSWCEETTRGFSARTRNLLQRTGNLENQIDAYRRRNSNPTAYKDSTINGAASEEDLLSIVKKSTAGASNRNPRRRKSVVF